MVKINNVKKIFFSILTVLLLISSVLFIACNKSDEDASINVTANYKIVKVGERVVLEQLYAVDKSGNKHETVVTLFNAVGDEISVEDNGFVPDKQGKYTAVYGGKDISCKPFSFYYYVTVDGSEFSFSVPKNELFENLTVEWNKKVVLPQVEVVSVVNGVVGDASVNVYYVDESNNETAVTLSENSFVPNGVYSNRSYDCVSKYRIEYGYGENSKSFTVNCVDTLAPEIAFNNYSSDYEFTYNDYDFIPSVKVSDSDYVGLSDAELKGKYTATLYRENTNEVVNVTANGLFYVDCAKYFTLKVVATDNAGRKSEKSIILKRAFDERFDRVSAVLCDGVLSWEDRSSVSDEYSEYPNVVGYSVSFDGGKTYSELNESVCNDRNYSVSDLTEFTSIVVREEHAEGYAHTYSETLYFDGAAKVFDTSTTKRISTFDGNDYMPLTGMGTCSEWEYNSLNCMSYSVVDTDSLGNKGGFLTATTTDASSLKIGFGRSIKVSDNGILKIRIFGTMPVTFVYVGIYGIDSYGNYLSEEYGYTPNSWCTVEIPAKEFLNWTKGETDFILTGIQIGFTNSTFYIDYVDYYEPCLIPSDLKTKLLDNQVMNFDNSDYSLLIDGTSVLDYELSGGNLVLNSNYFEGGAKLSFVTPKIVAEGDFIAIRIKSKGRVVLDNENGTSLSGTDVYFVMEYYPSEWSYAPLDYYQTVIFPVSKLGYSVGETINGLYLCNWEDVNTVYVDYIEYFNFTDCAGKEDAEYAYAYAKSKSLISGLENYEVINFKNDDCSNLIIKQGYSKIDVKNGVLSVLGTDYNSVKLIFATPKTVKENDFLLIRLSATARLTVTNEFNVAEEYKELINDNHSESWVYKSSSEFIDVLIPISKIGYAAGDTIRAICLKNHNESKNEFFIDGIKYLSYGQGDADVDEVVRTFVKDELTSKLGTNEVVNFNNTDLYSMIYTDGEVADGVYSSKNNQLYIEFLNKVEIAEDDYFIIKLLADFDLSIFDKDGNNAKRILGEYDGYDEYEWCYSYADSYKTIVIPVSELGFVSGDVVDGIKFLFEQGKTLNIDFIKVSSSDSTIESVKLQKAINKLKDDLSDNQLANYNSQDYRYLISDYDETYNYVSNNGEYRNSLSALTNGKVDIGKLVKLFFVSGKTVTANTYFVIKIKSTTDVVVYGENKINGKYLLSGSSALSNEQWTYIAKNSYVTAIVPASVLGYGIGDTAKAIYVGNAVENGMLFIDCIEAVEMASGLHETLAVATYYDLVDSDVFGLTERQVMNFDNDGYSEFISTGEVTVSNNDGYYSHSGTYYVGRAKITFINPLKVTETTGKTDYLVLRIKATARVAIDGENASVMSNSSSTGYPNYLIVKEKANDYSWAYLKSNDYQTVIVPVSYLGYGAGDTINGIVLTNWDDSTSFSIDWIEYVEMASGLTKSTALTTYNKMIDTRFDTIRNEIDGTDKIFTFDSDDYYAVVSGGTIADGEFTSSATYQAGAVTFTLADEKTVTSQTGMADYLVLRIKVTAGKRLVIGGFDSDMMPSTTVGGAYYCFHNDFAKDDWIYSATGEYQTIIIPLSAIGYGGGDRFGGFKITNWDDNSSFSLDYVLYITSSSALTEKEAIDEYVYADIRKELEGTNYLLTFDSSDYSMLVDKGTVADGEFGYNKQYDFVTFTFVNPVTVTSESGKTGYLVFKIKSNVRTRLASYNGVTSVEFIHAGSNEYAKEWIYQTSSSYQIAIVPVSRLGYNAGDTIEGVKVGVWGSDYFYIDYIEYLTFDDSLTETEVVQYYTRLPLINGLEGDQVMNFDIADYINVVSCDANSSATVEDGTLNVTATGYSNVTLTFVQSKTVSITEDTEDYVVVRITADNNCKIDNKWFFHGSHNADWCYTRGSGYSVIMVPVSYLGYSDGGTISQITLTINGAGTFGVDWVEYVSLTTGLDKTTAPAAYETYVANR